MDPFSALTAQVRLMASGGYFSHARRLLRLLEAEYPIATVSIGLFIQLLTSAIVAHDPDVAVSWLKARFPASYEIEIDVGGTGSLVEGVRMRVNDDALQFQFNPGMFGAAGGEMKLGRWTVLFGLFDAFMKSAWRVNGGVTINLDDGGTFPGLAFCDFRPGFYLIPDAHYMHQARYEEMRLDFRTNDIRWEDRVPLAFWRGSTTGSPVDAAVGWRSIPRIRLCEIAAAVPEIIDAGITGVAQIADPAARDDLEARNLLRPRVSHGTFLHYRYLIDIDGNTNSWDGFAMRLMTGSTVLKVGSRFDFEQWYYRRLKPWVNFVPVAKDMSDLVEKVLWLRANDGAARRIGEAGRELAESLTNEKEIANSSFVIAAAIRADSHGPLIDLRLRSDAPGSDVLRSGWHAAEADGVNATGCEARIELPSPPGFGDYVLMVEVSPAAALPQRMMVFANGETISRQTVTERATVYCSLPRSVAIRDETLNLSFCFPDNSVNASQAHPLDAHTLSVKLHRIGVAAAQPMAWHDPPDLAALLAELNTLLTPAVVHDFGSDRPERSPLIPPPNVVPRTIHTCFGTILYADRETGRIRHGKKPDVPHNLFLVRHRDSAVLAIAAEDGRYFIVRVRPEGPDAPTDHWIPWAAGGFARMFTMVDVTSAAQGTFALRSTGLFACAEETGEFTLSRIRPGPWESFNVGPDDR
jgi:Glycosyl transferase family 90